MAVAWCRPAAAAPIQPLDWELPYATGTAQKSKTNKQTNKNNNNNNNKTSINITRQKSNCNKQLRDTQRDVKYDVKSPIMGGENLELLECVQT